MATARRGSERTTTCPTGSPHRLARSTGGSDANSGAIYHDGWKASFGYRPDFIDLYQSYPVPQTAENFAGKEVWELYNVNEDPTELNNVASQHPVRLAQMKALFDMEARANQVCPLMNWSDIFVGIRDFQIKAGLLPGAAAPQK
jgi:arylsulfatase A-like enzyme